MNANHVHELARATLTGTLPFPEIVGKLMAENVEYYHVDYVALQMSFYSTEGSVVVAPLSFETVPAVAKDFDAAALKAAILDSQKHGQKFRDFCHRAAEAGVAGYFAFLRGKQVTYFGRQGNHHVERFPGAKSTDV
jgi:uncharacterized protein YbcV (DUF1398 family)